MIVDRIEWHKVLLQVCYIEIIIPKMMLFNKYAKLLYLIWRTIAGIPDSNYFVVADWSESKELWLSGDWFYSTIW